MKLAIDKCVVCCDDSVGTKEVGKYTVGLCEDHEDMTVEDILSIITDELE